MQVDHLRQAARAEWTRAHQTASDLSLVVFFGDRFATMSVASQLDNQTISLTVISKAA